MLSSPSSSSLADTAHTLSAGPNAGFKADQVKNEEDHGVPFGPGKTQTAPQFPEGGVRAWLVVVGCWCISFVSFGYANSFGFYETYYLETYLSGYSPSTIAWIGSLQTFAQFSATLISGSIADRYGPVVIIRPFSLLAVIAMMLTSLCTEFYQFLLCQGILLGVSSGLIYAPALSVVGHYFFKRRAMAMAFASTGSPVGGIIFPVIMANLVRHPNIGFGWAQRICAFLSLFLVGIAAVTIRPTKMRRKGNFFLPEAFSIPAFSLQVAALFMTVLGIWTPYFYLAEYGLAHGMSPSLASYLFAVINGGSLIGRLIGGTVAQRAGQFNVTAFACYASAILMFCWLKINTAAGLLVFSLLFGATSGMVIALMMPTIAHTADHPSKIGTFIGMSTFVIGFAALAGTPATGALINSRIGYSHGIVFSASVIMAGAILFTCARFAHGRGKLIV